MKQFHYEYPWTENTEWMLPDGELMMQNQFGIMDEQIDAILAIIGNQRTCVQAGGAMGMYPLRLADHFEKVFTFEPLRENLECLWMNIFKRPRSDNIFVRENALWNMPDVMLQMEYSKPVKNSYGAHHVAPHVFERGKQVVKSVTIDSLLLEEVDLIWLDVEGAELFALQGAESVLKRNRPVVVLEDHALVQMQTVFKVKRDAAAKYLMNEHGYKFAGKSHHDLMFVPK